MGMSHGRPNTFAQLAEEVAFVSVSDGVAAVRVVASIYRDFGNRADRKQARLKYLIDKKGVKWFREEFAKRAEFEVHPWRELEAIEPQDWLGKFEQGDGKWFYGVFVHNGRIIDSEATKIRSACREIVTQLNCPVTFTPQQSIIFRDLEESQIAELESILKKYDVPLVEELSNAMRYTMACPAMPTCGLAVAESERASADIIGEIENKLAELKLDDVPITIRMTGCPNGCARPYTADIALVGRRPGVYHLFVGGRLAGDRMADLYAGDVKVEELIETLTPLLTKFAADRLDGEGFGDFYQRLLSVEKPRRRVTGKETPTFDDVEPLVQLGSA